MMLQWVAIALVVAAAFAALKYMAAKLLNNPYLLSSAKMDIAAWFEALFLLALYLLLLSLLSPIVESLVTSQGWDVALGMECEGMCLPQLSAAVVEGHLQQAQSLLEDLSKALPKATLSHMGFGFESVKLLYANTQYAMGYRNQFQRMKVEATLSLASLAITPLAALYAYLKDMAFPLGSLFLSLGIVMRAISYTRRLGSTLIAMGITSLLALPILTLFFLSPSMAVGSSPSSSFCPASCSFSPVAIGNLEPIYAPTVEEWVAEGLLSREEAEAFLMGSLPQVEVEGKRYTSCNSLGAPSPAERDSYAPGESIGNLTCKEQCRLLPFPNLPECRKAEPFCSKAFASSQGLCFQPLFTATHLAEKVPSIDGSLKPLGEVMAESECFTLPPLLPFPLDKKPRYPYPIPEGCRYLLLQKEGGEWQISLPRECQALLKELPNGAEVEALLLSYAPADPQAFVDSIKAWLSNSENWQEAHWEVVRPPMGEAFAIPKGAPLEAFSPVGYIVRGEQCPPLPPSKLLALKGVDCSSCSSPTLSLGVTMEDRLSYLIAIGWGGTALAIGSSAMFLIALSMALQGFMFIPALGRLV